jgi:hypothetical protein
MYCSLNAGVQKITFVILHKSIAKYNRKTENHAPHFLKDERKKRIFLFPKISALVPYPFYPPDLDPCGFFLLPRMK